MRTLPMRALWLWTVLSLASLAHAQTSGGATGQSTAPGDAPVSSSATPGGQSAKSPGDNSALADAQPAAAEAMTEAETLRLKTLSAELRCLVCQNQSLADSNADLAIDLRNQVRDQIRAGKSDGDIKDYLVQRYGEFVLYRPRVSSLTWVLWAGPFLLLALGAVAMATYLRRRQRAQAGVDDTRSGEQLERARALLRGDTDGASSQDVNASLQERAP